MSNGKLEVDFIFEKFEKINNPIIIKPEDGVGAESILYFKSKSQIEAFFRYDYDLIAKNRTYILQEFIPGDDLSVSLIPNPNYDNIILGINKQQIEIFDPKNSIYLGGYTPVRNFEKVRSNLKKLLRQIDLKCFNGYFGIDFIRKQDGSLNFIEINPRLTTSYVGIRNISDKNPLEFLTKSSEYVPKYFSKFMRIELYYKGTKDYNELNEVLIPDIVSKIPEIVTPPIALKSSRLKYSCFIATKTTDLESSEIKYKEIIATLEDYGFYKLN
jgi:predicted ATP-grasp superfamily ATP-dependent carboligase